MKKFLLVVLLLFAAGLIYGGYLYMQVPVSVQVSQSVEPAAPLDIPGVYTANRDDATDILELKPDGSYARNYRPQGGTTLIHQGQWTRDGDNMTFTNFAVAPDIDASASDAWRTSRRSWTTRVIVSRREVQIVINAERALIYSKRD